MGRGAKQVGNDRPVVVSEGGRVVLRVGGVIQSVHVDETYTSDIWDAMLPRERPRNALILGLGGGTMAALLTRHWGGLPIVGVEHDPAVVWLAKHEFGLAQQPHVEIVTDDAFAWVARCQQQFDLICVDLYTAGKLAHGVFEPAFLRNLARIVHVGGAIHFNLWQSAFLDDQVRRLARVFSVVERVFVEENVVIRCVRRDEQDA